MNTSDLELFLRIADTASITATANQRGLTPAAVSYAIKRLEQQLKVQLFVRSTRQMRITEEGEKFLFHARQALDILNRGQYSLRQSGHRISGTLRCSVPSDLGRNLVFKWLDLFLDDHPALAVDINVNDSLVNFYAEQVDVALRYGKPQDSSLIAFHIASVARVTCASADYLAHWGVPQTPADLAAHRCLLYRRQGRLFNEWCYWRGDERYKIKVGGVRASNDTDMVRRWAVAGRGITYRSALDVEADLSSGALQQLLDGYQSPAVELYLVCASRAQVTPAVVAFREMLRQRCAGYSDSVLSSRSENNREGVALAGQKKARSEPGFSD